MWILVAVIVLFPGEYRAKEKRFETVVATEQRCEELKKMIKREASYIPVKYQIQQLTCERKK